MRTINPSNSPHASLGWKSKLCAILLSLFILLTVSAPGLAFNPGPLQATPTPTPAPGGESSPADVQELTRQVQSLGSVITDLQTEIQNLKSEIQNLQSLVSGLYPETPNPTLALLEELGGQPCPDDSAFTCVTLTVPLDHFDPANRQTIDVVFGVLPATGERKGMFVTATGGPGTAGLSYADSYLSGFDPSIPEHFDIVFFDQRGVGLSGGLTCPRAATAYYETDTETKTPEGEAAAVAAAQKFSDACVAELGSTDLLLYLGTRQAVEDLELFRQAMGNNKLWLYGESYGTQYAQTYAATYPDQLAGLLLDGTVDLTLTGFEYYQEWAQAFNDVLVMTLDACDADEDCTADMGQDALTTYDDLAAQLAAAPRPFTFPLPSGGTAEREFTLADLEVAASNYLYSEATRLLLQRALAAAAQDDLVPLARLLYDSLSLDPETLEPILDPTYSDAIYYGVECNDYPVPGDIPTERAETYLRAGDPVDNSVPRLSSIFYGDFPCVFWPTAPEDESRPAPLVAPGIPTLVLGATADPATPVQNGQRVYSRLDDGYLITTQGGAHVIYGRGNACPDDLVTTFLVEDKVPDQRETICEGVVADAYIPLPPADASDFANPLEALLSADTEINYLPEYYYWDVETPTSVGCPQGGTLAFEAGDEGDEFTLTGCAFSAGFVMTGTGLYRYDDGSFTLDVSVVGPEDVSGDLVYERNENGALHVTGQYNGEAIDLDDADIPEDESGSAPPVEDGTTEVALATAEPAPEATTEPAPTAEPTESEEPSAANPTVAVLAQLGGQPCPDNTDFTCIKLTVPLDHFDPANPETIELLWAVLPASGERKGMFVTANGGPGISGVAYADSYDYIDPRLAENFDIVHFDLRGVAGSGDLYCYEASAAFHQADWGGQTPEQEAAYAQAARTFAENCISEMGLSPEKLRFYSTNQAVEDLEFFRQAIGADKFWLYGLSYGTQLGQIYAAAHPDHLAGLMLDGVVDLTLSGTEYWAGVAQKDNNLLVAILEACNADAACAADMGGNALAAYDQLAARLEQSPQPFAFPLPSGETAQREFDFFDLETAAANYLYPADARMLFVRALASAVRDNNLIPLIRLVYAPLGIDPQTLAAIPDPTWSEAMYYVTTCNDYTYRLGTPEESAASFFRVGDAIDDTVPRLTSVFYGDMPCVFWPKGEDNAVRPAPLVAAGIPTLVIGATGDPTTPVEYGEQVYRRLADGYLITVEGGGHVMFGEDNACVDGAVVAFLVEGTLPAQKETTCADTLVEPYIPLTPAAATEFANPLAALAAAETEINYLPEYYYWDDFTPTSVGCTHGGTLAFEPGKDGNQFSLTHCAFTADFALTGSGTTGVNGTFFLNVAVNGPLGVTGQLTYQRDANDQASVTGEYGGQAVDLAEE